MYLAGFIVRVSYPTGPYYKIVAKAIFAINTILLFMRFTRFYAVSSKLGPKVCCP